MIPIRTKNAIKRYVENRISPGGFLRAVLENNLFSTFSRADSENEKALREIMGYVYWEIPAKCWGSEEKVKKWLEGGKK